MANLPSSRFTRDRLMKSPVAAGAPVRMFWFSFAFLDVTEYRLFTANKGELYLEDSSANIFRVNNTMTARNTGKK